MKKWLHIFLILILAGIGIPLGLSSLYFIAAPLPRWLEDNSIALYFYTNSLGNCIYALVSLVIGYLLVVCALYIAQEMDKDSPAFNPKDSLKKSFFDYL